MPIEICKVDENLYVLYWLRFRPFFDSVNLFLSHPNTIRGDNGAQESDLILVEIVLFQICIKAIFPEDFQNPSNSFDIALP